MSADGVARLRLRDVAIKGAWQLAILPVPGFPVPLGQAGLIAQFCLGLASLLTGKYQLMQQVVLQSWKLGPQTGMPELRAHRREWRTELGTGIWPDRLAPAGWTEEGMVDAAAAALRGDEPALPAHRTLRLRCSLQEGIAAAARLHPLGVALQMFSPLSTAEVDARCREVFLPRITERRFQNELFYTPLLDRASFLHAASSEELDQCLGGATVYLRASAEDQGLLLLSRIPLETLLGEVSQLLQAGVGEAQKQLPA